MVDENPGSRSEISGEHAVVENASMVTHADTVNNSAQTDVAGTVNHAENVEIHGEPVRSDRTRKLSYIRDIARWGVVLFALLVMVVVIFDKNARENQLETQLTEFKADRAASDAVTAKKLECSRRYNDRVDADRTQQLLLIGQFLVVITQNPPGPERTAEAQAIGDQLETVNEQSKKDVAERVEYNNHGASLPCPIPPTAPSFPESEEETP